MVDEYDVGLVGNNERTQFVGFAAADKITRIGTIAVRADGCNRRRARGTGEFGELVEIRRAETVFENDVNEDRPFARLRAFKQSGSP